MRKAYYYSNSHIQNTIQSLDIPECDKHILHLRILDDRLIEDIPNLKKLPLVEFAANIKRLVKTLESVL